MDNSNKDFLHSLDLPHREMEKYIPFVLQDLWDLGSNPDYMIKIIQDNIKPYNNIKKIVDFGCGKGAALIKLSKIFDFIGLGIDIVPEFINSAKQYARENFVSDRIKFEIGDIKDYVSKTKDYDLVIYGYDSGILGDVKETLLQLKKCIHAGGWIIIEIAYTPDGKNKIEGLPNEKELHKQLEESGLTVVDKIIWEISELRKTNNRNNNLIRTRINELMILHPGKRQMFQMYMDNQIEECRLIENDMICSTLLLKK